MTNKWAISNVQFCFNKSDSAACPEDLPYKCVRFNQLSQIDNFYCSVNRPNNGIHWNNCDPYMSCTRTSTQNCDNYGSFITQIDQRDLSGII